MEAWAIATFPSDGMGGVIVYQDDTGYLSCDPSVFGSQAFAGVSAPPTYAALSQLAIASEGWQKVFDQWKARGLIT
jgi:hypothetical protein